MKQIISGNRKEIKLNEPYRIVSCGRDLNVQANVKEVEKRIRDKYKRKIRNAGFFKSYTMLLR